MKLEKFIEKWNNSDKLHIVKIKQTKPYLSTSIYAHVYQINKTFYDGEDIEYISFYLVIDGMAYPSGEAFLQYIGDVS